MERQIITSEKNNQVSVSQANLFENSISENKVVITLVQGFARTFKNYEINHVKYTFGFPQSECPDKRVWIGKNGKEVKRISLQEAYSIINSNKYLIQKHN